ncbi:hypothetical protein LTR84_006883 [Exophiala bonariae]|uniref:Uncharacterized protein n=1 Tax=Exophiala bonariae TaxID=1690606 RepID=A0AAV9N3A6_9EURO|nr:hypothetical protein LTR84_006883 [Exophiala bonariae]
MEPEFPLPNWDEVPLLLSTPENNLEPMPYNKDVAAPFERLMMLPKICTVIRDDIEENRLRLVAAMNARPYDANKVIVLMARYVVVIESEMGAQSTRLRQTVEARHERCVKSLAKLMRIEDHWRNQRFENSDDEDLAHVNKWVSLDIQEIDIMAEACKKGVFVVRGNQAYIQRFGVTSNTLNFARGVHGNLQAITAEVEQFKPLTAQIFAKLGELRLSGLRPPAA